jgi:hypothetical protein
MKNLLYVLSLVGQLGFIIALPAALFAYGGAILDRQLGTSPLFILLGLGLAIVSSSLWVYRFVQKIK